MSKATYTMITVAPCASDFLKDALGHTANNLKTLLQAIELENTSLNGHGVNASAVADTVRHALSIITQDSDLDALNAHSTLQSQQSSLPSR